MKLYDPTTGSYYTREVGGEVDPTTLPDYSDEIPTGNYSSVVDTPNLIIKNISDFVKKNWQILAVAVVVVFFFFKKK